MLKILPFLAVFYGFRDVSGSENRLVGIIRPNLQSISDSIEAVGRVHRKGIEIEK